MDAVAGEAFDGAGGGRHADRVFVHQPDGSERQGATLGRSGSSTWIVPVVPSTSMSAPGREASCRVVHIDHAGNAEFAGHHRRMRHRSAEFGDDGGRVGERGGVSDVGDFSDEDLPGLQVVDGVRPDDPDPPADPAAADAGSDQKLAG